jgi:ABC-type glycerol-3-phosphate transport system permease component
VFQGPDLGSEQEVGCRALPDSGTVSRSARVGAISLILLGLPLEGRAEVRTQQVEAAAIIFTVPPLLFFAGLQRYLISGLTGGAVKG